MKFTSLEDLLTDELKDLYSAENQMIRSLPKMAKAASSDELRTAFETHLEQTRGHVDRLEQIAEDLHIKPKGKRCVGMEGLIEESKEMLTPDSESSVADAGLICEAQKIEHYEIAAYGTARAHAEQLGYTKVAEILQQTLNEEKETDARLTDIAENKTNVEAASVDVDVEEVLAGEEMFGSTEQGY